MMQPDGPAVVRKGRTICQSYVVPNASCRPSPNQLTTKV